MNIVIDGSIQIKCDIIRSKRKNLLMLVQSNNSIVVKAPLLMSDKRIHKFIDKNHNWIKKHLPEIKSVNTSGTIANNEDFYFLGKLYKIIIKQASHREYVKLDYPTLTIFSKKPNDSENFSKIFYKWLNKTTLNHFHKTFDNCFKKFKAIPRPSIKIRPFKSQWGSYSRRNIVSLNMDLIALPSKFLEYIIFHELCHYFHLNHSKDFYDLLQIYIPNWKELDKQMHICPIIKLW